MMKNYTNCLSLFIFIVLTSCVSGGTSTRNPEFAVKKYQASLVDAVFPDAEKVSDQLIQVDNSNPNITWATINNEKYVLTATWKSTNTFYLDKGGKDSLYTYNTGQWDIWVTIAPELLNRMSKERYNDATYNMRLKQLLGLPPTANYKYFIEFWVKPEDLFRPCPDNEINDSNCELSFPKETSDDYINWVNQNRVSRYFNGTTQTEKYPWTQLGYTYDWNPKNKSHVGLSEFVIKTGSDVYVNKIYTTKEYLNKRK